MQTLTLTAHVDGMRIVLDEKFDLPVNAPLTVTVLGGGTQGDDSEAA